MELKVVTTKQGLVFVDETAEIFGGNQYVDDTSLIKKAIIYDRDHWLQRPECDLIIASINFSIDKDFPMVIMDGEVMELVDKEYPLFNTIKGPNIDWHCRLGRREGFINGFIAAKQKGMVMEMKQYKTGVRDSDVEGLSYEEPIVKTDRRGDGQLMAFIK